MASVRDCRKGFEPATRNAVVVALHVTGGVYCVSNSLEHLINGLAWGWNLARSSTIGEQKVESHDGGAELHGSVLVRER